MIIIGSAVLAGVQMFAGAELIGYVEHRLSVNANKLLCLLLVLSASVGVGYAGWLNTGNSHGSWLGALAGSLLGAVAMTVLAFWRLRRK